MAASEYDVAVVGGGLVGAATSWGLAREGLRVALLDEGDRAVRASRGNFALVWVQSKGLGMPAYTGWTVRASETWGKLAAELKYQYVLGYQSTNRARDGSWRKIRVKVTAPKGSRATSLDVRARAGYLAAGVGDSDMSGSR